MFLFSSIWISYDVYRIVVVSTDEHAAVTVVVMGTSCNVFFFVDVFNFLSASFMFRSSIVGDR